MFLPFIGLTLAAVSTVGLVLRPLLKPAAAFALASAVLAAFAFGTYTRNKVWLNETTLWQDVAEKSPKNGRGLMNRGLALMAAGDYVQALDYFNRAQAFTPNYYVLEINQGILHGQLGHDADAEAHFARALRLAPESGLPHHYYARWLTQRGRQGEALPQIRKAIALNPEFLASQDVLHQAESGLSQTARSASTPEQYLDLSLKFHQARKFDESIKMALTAIKLKPDFAEAYNNMAAAYEELGQWDEAIQASSRAVQLKPDFTLARNNLAWSLAQKSRSAK